MLCMCVCVFCAEAYRRFLQCVFFCAFFMFLYSNLQCLALGEGGYFGCFCQCRETASLPMPLRVNEFTVSSFSLGDY